MIRRTKGTYVPTGEQESIWHCDICNRDCTTANGKSCDNETGEWCIFCTKKGIKAPLKMISVNVVKYIRGTVEKFCCNQWLLCNKFTNTCEICKSDYNHNGSKLTSREFWGEETGETANDIIGI